MNKHKNISTEVWILAAVVLNLALLFIFQMAAVLLAFGIFGTSSPGMKRWGFVQLFFLGVQIVTNMLFYRKRLIIKDWRVLLLCIVLDIFLFFAFAFSPGEMAGI